MKRISMSTKREISWNYYYSINLAECKLCIKEGRESENEFQIELQREGKGEGNRQWNDEMALLKHKQNEPIRTKC